MGGNKSKFENITLFKIILILMIIFAILCLNIFSAEISNIFVNGITSVLNADSDSVAHYYHLDIRVDGEYVLPDGTTGTAVINSIKTVTLYVDGSSEDIDLSIDSSPTADESDSSVYEYKSVLGHEEGSDIGLTSEDSVIIELVFTYENITRDISIQYDLDEENNLCTGTKGSDDYGYDIEISIQEYVDESYNVEVDLYEYTINYYYNGVQAEEQTVEGTAELGMEITAEDKSYYNDEQYDLDEENTLTDYIEITDGTNILNIYYVSQSVYEVVVKYVDIETGEEIADSEIITGISGTEYETEQKEIEGYTYTSDTGNTTGTIEDSNISVIYYYTADEEPTYTVTVMYVDIETGEEIATTETITGTTGDIYITEQKEIDDYTYTDDTGNTAGVIGSQDITVIYYYTAEEELIYTITVMYVDIDTGEKIADSETITGTTGTEYETEQKEIEGYTYTSDTENTEGTIETENIEVIYYYTKNGYTITTRYVDVETGEEIATTETSTGTMGDTYTTEQKEIEGYTYTSDTGNTEGTIETENIEVIYYYTEDEEEVITYTVTIKYIDEDTGEEIAETITLSGNEGDEYITEQEEIDGYTFSSVSGETSGTLTEDVEVIYYYTKDAEEVATAETINTGDILPIVVFILILVVIAINIVQSVYTKNKKDNK